MFESEIVSYFLSQPRTHLLSSRLEYPFFYIYIILLVLKIMFYNLTITFSLLSFWLRTELSFSSFIFNREVTQTWVFNFSNISSRFFFWGMENLWLPFPSEWQTNTKCLPFCFFFPCVKFLWYLLNFLVSIEKNYGWPCLVHEVILQCSLSLFFLLECNIFYSFLFSDKEWKIYECSFLLNGNLLQIVHCIWLYFLLYYWITLIYLILFLEGIEIWWCPPAPPLFFLNGESIRTLHFLLHFLLKFSIPFSYK